VTAVAEAPPTAVRAKPFVRWTGGKSKLLPELLKWIPTDFGTFHEPFLGSGALFFELQHQRPHLRAVLSDANTRLTCAFGAIQRDVDEVLPPLRVYAEMYAKHGAAFYTHVRDNFSPDQATGPEIAAWFVFLLKTGFNGIWRVNRAGKYNVPAGRFTLLPNVCDEPLLRACSMALTNAIIVNSDFREVERRAQPGDLTYFDSPYYPTSETADFTAYTAGGFGHADQVALRDLAVRLKRRGVHVVLSNADVPAVRDLYAGFEIREITRSGGINADVSKRGKVSELLIR
jgi:DNA adenine methylase